MGNFSPSLGYVDESVLSWFSSMTPPLVAFLPLHFRTPKCDYIYSSAATEILFPKHFFNRAGGRREKLSGEEERKEEVCVCCHVVYMLTHITPTCLVFIYLFIKLNIDHVLNTHRPSFCFSLIL